MRSISIALCATLLISCAGTAAPVAVTQAPSPTPSVRFTPIPTAVPSPSPSRDPDLFTVRMHVGLADGGTIGRYNLDWFRLTSTTCADAQAMYTKAPEWVAGGQYDKADTVPFVRRGTYVFWMRPSGRFADVWYSSKPDCAHADTLTVNSDMTIEFVTKALP
ncbi:MAG: hypothetical protein KGJ98_10590 [Chloroflexota bacterium]|nr:hypothetical protein [Chloroflexota bacterium]